MKYILITVSKSAAIIIIIVKIIVMPPTTIRKILNPLLNFSFTAPVPTLANPIISNPIMRKKMSRSVENPGSPKVARNTTKDSKIKRKPEINFVAFPAVLRSSLFIAM